MEVWRINLLGGLAAQGEQQTIVHFRTQKTGALLAYLAYFPRPHAREVLIEVLWPGCAPQRGRDSLRTALAALRHQLEPPDIPAGSILRANRQDIGLNPQAATTDVAAFESALQTADEAATTSEKMVLVAAALKLYQGHLLAGYYEGWIPAEAQRLEHLYCEAALGLVNYGLQARDLARAIDAAAQAIAHHPLHEELHCALMRAYAAQGRVIVALRQYEALQQLLRQWDAVPGDTARQLAEQFAALVPRRHNLPDQTVVLVGRDLEIPKLRNLVLQMDTQLLTLTGPGGVGKTSLALQVARELAPDFRDGVCFVALAPLTEARLVVTALAQALGVQETGQIPLLKGVQEFLAGKRLLLVLDNFEHVAEAATQIAALRQSCPGLKVLATSRSTLRVSEEQEYPVAPLARPRGKPWPAFNVLTCFPALQLFAARAAAVQPEFKLTADNAPYVAEICARLDGLPLALELAASRMNIMSPAETLERLGEKLDLLQNRARSVAPRHRSLRAVVAWSYGLLDRKTQNLLAQLSLFAGGFTLAAAAAVCSTRDTLSGITELKCHTLLATTTDTLTQQTRFFLLESVRDYAAEKLRHDRVRQTRLQRRHAEYYLHLAEQYGQQLRTSDEGRALRAWEGEFDNLRAALNWASTSRDAPLYARLTLALYPALSHLGFWTEARQYLQLGHHAIESHFIAAHRPRGRHPTVRQPTVTPVEALRLRARLAQAMASLSHDIGDLDMAEREAQQCLGWWRELNDSNGLADTLNLLGLLATDRARLEAAHQCFSESLELRAADDYLNRAKTLHNLARIESCRGDLEAARQLYAETLQLRRLAGDLRGEAATLGNLGGLAFNKGDYVEARRLYRTSLTLHRTLRNPHGIGLMLANLAEIAEMEHDFAYAVNLYTHAERIFRDLHSSHVTYPEVALSRLKTKLGSAEFSTIQNHAAHITLQELSEL